MDIATVSNAPQQFCVMSATQTFVDSHHTINHNQSINQSITSFYATLSYLYSRANVTLKCNSSLFFYTRNQL